MNRSTLAVAACLLAVAGLAGCASDDRAPPPAPAPAPVAAPAPPPPPAMPANMTPAQQRVAKLQMALNANGAQVDVDGKLGAKTVAALKTYQKAHNLHVTGKADPATVKALGG